MKSAAASGVLLEAVRADVRARVEAIVRQLETDVDRLDRRDEIETVLRAALDEVTDVLAEGLVAHLRETRRAGRIGQTPL